MKEQDAPSGLVVAVRRAAPKAELWAVREVVKIQLAAIRRDAGRVAILADFATALAAARNGGTANDARGRPRGNRPHPLPIGS